MGTKLGRIVADQVSKPIRILIVDDHTLLREGTRQLLEQDPGLVVVGEVARGDETVAAVELLLPDVLLLDIRLPGMNGIDIAREVARRFPAVRVLILSAYADDDYVHAAIGAGASGFLLKTTPGNELVGAIHIVQGGATVFDAAITRKLGSQQHLSSGSSRPPVELTDRESEILKLVYNGLANKAIAAQLGISPRTVEGHLHRILNKVDVTSRTGLLKYALEHHLVSPDPEL
jgi:DNA-binding NarL/FixJ family response regulator